MFRKILVCPKKFFRPLKWYTDRKFFGDGGGRGGGGRQKKFSPEKIFFALNARKPPGFEPSELGSSGDGIH